MLFARILMCVYACACACVETACDINFLLSYLDEYQHAIKGRRRNGINNDDNDNSIATIII